MELREERLKLGREIALLEGEDIQGAKISMIHWRRYIFPAAVLAASAALLLTKALAAGNPYLHPLLNVWSRGGTMPMFTGQAADIVSFMENLSLLVLAAAAVVCVMRLKSIRYILTNKRLLIRSGWLRRYWIHVQLHRCKAVGVRQSVVARLFNTADITVSTPEIRTILEDVTDYEPFSASLQRAVSEMQIEDKGEKL